MPGIIPVNVINDDDNGHHIEGTVGNDEINGNGGSDTLVGLQGDDVLNGGEGNDALLGDSYPENSDPAGHDILMGGEGDDRLYGGGGVDQFDGGSGFDRVYFNFRAATQGVWANLATQTISNDGFGNAETMVSIEGLGPGTAFADTFIGSDQFDFFEGSFGDTLIGHGGNDAFEVSGAPALINGNDGVDMLSFFSMLTALVPDTNGDGLAEIVFAAHGVNVDLGINRIIDDGFGRSGEVYNVESLVGSRFADRLVGSAGNNFMQGLGGDDVMSGGGGSDSLEGGDGNDALDAGADFDSAHFTFQAGPGALTLVADADGLSVMRDGERVAGISVNGATVRVQGVNSGAHLGGDDLTNVEQLNFWIAGSPLPLNVRVTTGTAADNLLIGAPGHDIILGLGSDDTMLGLAGNDLIDGAGGNDLLLGDGTSTYLGQAGNDVLRGGAGDDFLSGGGGVDILDGGSGLDTVGFFHRNATQGAVVDLLTQAVANDGYGNAETLVSIEGIGPGTVHADHFAGDHGPNILQGDYADILIGNDGDDVFQVSGAPAATDGGGGIDTISFFGEISGSQAPDNDGNGLTEIVFATAGINVDLSLHALVNDGFGRSGSIINVENVIGGSLADIIYGSHLNNVLSGNAGDDVLRGYGGGDTLEGGDGNDALDGGKGADRLVGGGGDDILAGGTDADSFEFGPNSGHDRIIDFGSKDVILILGVAGIDDFFDIAIVDVGKDALVSWGTADSILVHDYKASKLSAADFAFSEPATIALMAMDGSHGGGTLQLLPWETFTPAA
ncbi:MAG TPA: calcium-binding protein [Allosphingosinicella sp.]|jgi:Ca2+-binding RTX toxin-like protein